MALSVLYGCDNNYAPYTGISMTSLFYNNKDIDEITVYLAAMEFDEENLSKFRSVAKQYNRALVILDTKRAIMKMQQYNCGSWNGSIATWLRFFVLDQIPDSVDRLVWIDSDTIIGSGLKSLLEEDIGEHPVAAVCDCLSYYERFRLGFDLKSSYYNAGVLIFNLAIWRRDAIIGKLMMHLQENIEKYSLNDQDLLNDYFQKQVYRLPPQFNIQCFMMAYNIEDYYRTYRWAIDAYYSDVQMRNALSKPVILHFFRFLGDYPWSSGNNYHPARDIYEEWQKRTLWKDYAAVAGKKDLSFKLEKILYRLLPRRLFLEVFSWYTNRKLPHKPKI